MNNTARNRPVPVILSLVSSPVVERELTLDDHVRRACRGDRDAADVVARELRHVLLQVVRPHLGDFEDDADDVVDDLFVAMLEERFSIDPAPADAVLVLLRKAAMWARRHVRVVRGRWGHSLFD